MSPAHAVVARRFGIGAAIVAGGVMTAGGDSGPGICVVRHISGGYCPGCGGTRAAQHLLTGDVAAAWHDHPWVVLAVVQVVIAAAVGAGLLLSRSALGRPLLAADRRSSAVATVPWLFVAVANVAAVLGIWVTRLALGDIPAPF